jgi:hypothetical protein
MSEHRTGWIEHKGMTMRLRDDGRVDCYAAGGYRIYEWNDILPGIQEKLLKAREDSKDGQA